MRKENLIDPIFLLVDLFCGFGGTTLGFEKSGIAKIIACVNHDPKAIKSHWLNHPEVKHFEEDIRTLDLTELVKLCHVQKSIYPNAKLVLWASLECTNFSKAKGGQPRDADSRTLAEHLHRYIEALQPDLIQIENVVEFMSWGPLDENGKPVSKKSGEDWLKWRRSITEKYNYVDDWRELNSANFGAYTSRNRLFGIFAKDWSEIAWPAPTHSKNPEKQPSLFGNLPKWKPVKEVLNFSDEGKSIFERKKPLSVKTLERIYAGLMKFVAQGDSSFIAKYYSGNPKGKVISVEGPAGTVTCIDSQSIVNANFILKYNSMGKNGNHNPPSVEEPCPVVATQNRLGLIQTKFLMASNGGVPSAKVFSTDSPCRGITTSDNKSLVDVAFLQHYYGNGFNTSKDEPCPTLTTKDRAALVQPKYFIYREFKSATNSDNNEPAGAITVVPKMNVIKVEPFVNTNKKWHYLINPSWGGHSTSTDEPCVVIVARQDKAPLYLTQVEGGELAIAVYEHDTPIMIKIKEFMAIYGLVDIKMRMLRVPELLRIQGFPDSYRMEGNQSDHKKFIGNSVEPNTVSAWVKALGDKIMSNSKQQMYA